VTTSEVDQRNKFILKFNQDSILLFFILTIHVNLLNAAHRQLVALECKFGGLGTEHVSVVEYLLL